MATKRVVKLALVNQKGGVCKTTSAVTLGHLWAQNMKQVLIIDLDSQGNVAKAMGLERTDSLNQFLVNDRGMGAVTRTGREGLWAVLGDKSTAQTKQNLSSDPFGVFKLRDATDAIAQRFDAVIFDVAPSADILQLAALVACTHFIIPVSLEFLAMVGIRDAIESVNSLKKVNAFSGGLAGILPTKLDGTVKAHSTYLKSLADTFGRLVMPPIPTDTSVEKAQASGRTLSEYDPRCRAMVGVDLRGNGKRFGGYEAAARWLAQEVGL